MSRSHAFTGFDSEQGGGRWGVVTSPHTPIQLEVAIHSAHGLLKAGLVEQATLLLATFSPRELTNHILPKEVV